jgi:hypothetical protein
MTIYRWEWGMRSISPYLYLALKALDMELQKGDKNGTAD